MPGKAQLFLDRLEESMSIIIMRTHVEGLQSAEYGKAGAAGRNRADVHALDIVGLLDAVGDVSAGFTTHW
jgi:hypothetical protein